MKKTVLLFLLMLSLCLNCAALGEDASSTEILLEGSGVSCTSPNVNVSGKVVTITGAGDYVLKGEADDLQICVIVPDGKTTRVLLEGAELHCSFGPSLWFQGDTAQLIAVEGTENVVGDAENRVDQDSSPSSGVIFAEDSLSLGGNGTLQVKAEKGHGIHCKDYLVIEEMNLQVEAGNDGLRGNDGVSILSGSVTVIARGDGIQTGSEKSGRGNVALEGGVVVITAEKDAIQATGTVSYEGGSVTTRCGEGATNGL